MAAGRHGSARYDTNGLAVTNSMRDEVTRSSRHLICGREEDNLVYPTSAICNVGTDRPQAGTPGLRGGRVRKFVVAQTLISGLKHKWVLLG